MGKKWKVTLVILTASAVLMSSSYTMLIPFLPMYLIEELGVPASEVNLWSGAVFSISFLISGIMAPIWGALADRKSRKMMALRAAACLAISYALGGFVQTPMQLFMMRVVQGLAAGLWPATLAIMSSHAPNNRIGLCMGVMQGGLTAGHVLGPLAGGLLAEYCGMRASFFVAAAGLAIITVLLAVTIDEAPHAPVPKGAAASHAFLKKPAVQRMLIAATIVPVTIMMVQPVLPLYIAELQNSMDKVVLVSGIVFSIVGFSGIFASPAWGSLGQSWGFRPVLYTALFLSGIFGVVQAIPQDLTQFTIWRFIGGLTFAGIFPALNAILTQSTEPRERGKAFAYSYSVQQIGSVIGPFLGGAIATAWGNQMTLIVSGAMLFPLALWLFLMRPDASEASGKPLNSSK